MKNEIIIKKSKFITYLYNVDNDDKMNEILDNIRLEHKKATHICYAYIINNKVKINDDNEPKGTAGMPIYSVIEKNKLNNIIIIVVRYFGGIKLGAGGLFRAYSKSASEIIKLYKKTE